MKQGIHLIFVCLVIHALSISSFDQILEQRRLEIPAGAELKKLANENVIPITGSDRIRLHYRPSNYNRVSAFLLGITDTVTTTVENLETEPYYFSKPSASQYKVKISPWGGNVLFAVDDNTEAKKIMQHYRAKATGSSLLMLGGISTLAGMLLSFWIWPPDQGEIPWRIGTYGGSGIALLGFSVLPIYFNTGEIARAAEVYNR